MDPSVGDLTSLARALEEHRPRLLRMLECRIDASLRRRIDPGDVLADAFMKARSRWTEYCATRPLSLYAWLYQQTKDSLIAAWRRYDAGARDADREMPWPDDSSAALAAGLLGTGTTPSRALHRSEIAEKVRLAVGMLKASHREIIQMRHFDALTFVEAAEVVGAKVSTLEKRYVRALMALRFELKKVGVGPEEVW